jgi:hypothetical protein
MSADGNGYVGRSMKRKEDPRMITGEARYVDDITLPGMLHAAIVRSSEAHAAIVSIDVSGAEAREDVVAVFTGEDLAESFKGGLPMVWEQFGTNRTHEWGLSGGDIEAGLAEADAHGDCVLNMLILNKSVWDSGYWALAVFTVGGWAWLLGGRLGCRMAHEARASPLRRIGILGSRIDVLASAAPYP